MLYWVRGQGKSMVEACKIARVARSKRWSLNNCFLKNNNCQNKCYVGLWGSLHPRQLFRNHLAILVLNRCPFPEPWREHRDQVAPGREEGWSLNSCLFFQQLQKVLRPRQLFRNHLAILVWSLQSMPARIRMDEDESEYRYVYFII